MRIQPFVLGPYGTSCYTVYGYNGNECVFIDAPFPFSKALSFARSEGLSPKAVYLTHGHFDHIFGLGEIRKAFPEIPVYAGKEDLIFFENGYEKTLELLSSFDPLFLSRYAEPVIKEMPENVKAYGREASPFTVIPTPGHTPGSVSLYSETESILFSGDTLFAGSVGRTDLSGDSAALLQSLKKLKALPENTAVFPGHGMITKIGTEKTSNPYMR